MELIEKERREEEGGGGRRERRFHLERWRRQMRNHPNNLYRKYKLIEK
jgi:hypothetical protein